MLERKVEEPKITISIVSLDNGKFELAIQDNGGGVPEDIMDRIFEPYFTTKETGTGTGIGLYMAKEIIERQMHGKIYAENTPVGAKFIIIL